MKLIYEEALLHLQNSKIHDWCNYCGVKLEKNKEDFHILTICDESFFNCDNCDKIF